MGELLLRRSDALIKELNYVHQEPNSLIAVRLLSFRDGRGEKVTLVPRPRCSRLTHHGVVVLRVSSTNMEQTSLALSLPPVLARSLLRLWESACANTTIVAT